MAYFSNGSASECFDEQCEKCKYGEQSCPIWAVQFNYNYKACNNKIARKILDALVKNDGTCEMWTEFKDDFFKDTSQEELFGG